MRVYYMEECRVVTIKTRNLDSCLDVCKKKTLLHFQDCDNTVPLTKTCAVVAGGCSVRGKRAPNGRRHKLALRITQKS